VIEGEMRKRNWRESGRRPFRRCSISALQSTSWLSLVLAVMFEARLLEAFGRSDRAYAIDTAGKRDRVVFDQYQRLIESAQVHFPRRLALFLANANFPFGSKADARGLPCDV